MPRKKYSSDDYEDDGYDDYDDYDYDDELPTAFEEVEDQKNSNESLPIPSQLAPGKLWRCPVCTYDNRLQYLACEVCGSQMPQGPHIPLPTGQFVQLLSTTGTSQRASELISGTCEQSTLASLLCTTAPAVRKKQSLKAMAEGSSRKQLAFWPTTKWPDGIEAFSFDSPSPDELVLSAQTTGAAGKLATTDTKPSSVNNAQIPQTRDDPLVPSVSGQAPETLKARTSSDKIKQAQVTRRDAGVAMSSKATSDLLRNSENGRQKWGGDNSNPPPSSMHSNADDANAVAKGIKRLGLEAKGGSQERQALPLESYVIEPWMTEDLTVGDKEILHLVVVGHVDAGKSTLMGHLLHLLGCVPKKEMHRNSREAKEKGKGSFAFAWVLDEGAEERARGVTMSVAMAHFETPRKRVVLLDAPGHRDFVPSMISGAAQADAAILVIDATPGAFEDGMGGEGGNGGGQTREHAQLARSLGVENLIVAVNKLDSVDFQQLVFDDIRHHLSPFLKQCGFRDAAIRWLPISGLSGQNLLSAPTDARLQWYSGPSLLETIDTVPSPLRQVQRPLRMAVAEVLRSPTLGQAAVSGKLEGGALRPGMKVLVMPLGETASVKVVEQGGKSRPYARAGESADVGLTGVDPLVLRAGGVLCHPDFPVPVVTKFEARLLTLALTRPVLRGTQVVLHAHNAMEPARVSNLVALLDSKSGAVAKARPRALTSNQSALVEIEAERGICLEEYSNYRALGRVTIRESGRTLAVGIVTKLLEWQY